MRYLTFLAGIALLGCQTAQKRPDDEAVLEAVLLHFLLDNEKETTLAMAEGSKSIQLLRVSPEKTGMVLSDQVNQYLREHKLPDSLVEALFRRNKGAKDFDAIRTDYSRFKFDPRIKLVDEINKGKYGNPELPRGAKGYFQCYAPGYSSDGRTAVVRAWIGPTPHGAIATYFLEREGNDRRVKWREFAFFV